MPSQPDREEIRQGTVFNWETGTEGLRDEGTGGYGSSRLTPTALDAPFMGQTVLVVIFLFVAPVPVFFLVGSVAPGKVLMVAVGVALPLRVIGLLGHPDVMIVVVGIVDTGVDGAARGEHRGEE